MRFRIILFLSLLFTFKITATTFDDLEKDIHNVSENMLDQVVIIKVETKKYQKSGYFRRGSKLFTGSGVYLGKDSLVVTCNHMVDFDDIDRIRVYFRNNSNSYKAEILGKDELNDLALLKVENIPVKMDTVIWADINKTHVGQFVIALGEPKGLANTITFGVIGNIDRELESKEINPYIQSDVYITNGNSGGPLVNMKGEIVGINNKSALNMTFTIPAYVVKKSISEMEKGDLKKPSLGITTVNMFDSYKDFYSNDSLSGIIFVDYDYYYAGNKKMQCNDIILSINDINLDKDLENPLQYFKRVVNKSKIGSKVELTLLRLGKKVKVKIPVLEKPKEDKLEEYECDQWGINVAKAIPRFLFRKNYADTVKPGNVVVTDSDEIDSAIGIDDYVAIIGFVTPENKVIPISTIEDFKKIYLKHKYDKYVMLKVIGQDFTYYTILKRKFDDKKYFEDEK